MDEIWDLIESVSLRVFLPTLTMKYCTSLDHTLLFTIQRVAGVRCYFDSVDIFDSGYYIMIHAGQYIIVIF